MPDPRKTSQGPDHGDRVHRAVQRGPQEAFGMIWAALFRNIKPAYFVGFLRMFFSFCYIGPEK